MQDETQMAQVAQQ